MNKPSGDVTRLLRAWSDGDLDALNELLPLILDEARMIARRALAGEGDGYTLEPTELVNEAYLRLVERKTFWWQGRAQFFCAVAELMRRILVDRARKKKAAKRGGGAANLSLDESIFQVDEPHPDLALLDDALNVLKKMDQSKYDVVMLWFFVGLTQKEIARELEIGINTVGRRWTAARAFLRLEMSRAQQDEIRKGGAGEAGEGGTES